MKSDERKGLTESECNRQMKKADNGTLCCMERVKPACDLGRKMSQGK